jgi:hypothetical protein
MAPALQRLLTFQVPNLMSFFGCLGRAKESVQVRGALKHFVTMEISTARGWPHAQSPSLRITSCRLSVTAYLIYSQLSSVSGGLPSVLRTRHAVVSWDPRNIATLLLLFQYIQSLHWGFSKTCPHLTLRILLPPCEVYTQFNNYTILVIFVLPAMYHSAR